VAAIDERTGQDRASYLHDVARIAVRQFRLHRRLVVLRQGVRVPVRSMIATCLFVLALPFVAIAVGILELANRIDRGQGKRGA
jgi:hypothetical protein